MLVFFWDPLQLATLEGDIATRHLGQYTAHYFYIVSIATDQFKSPNDLATILAAELVGNIHDLPGQFFILPRPGTISSWSSKATDILHQCGYPVNRIERGITVAYPGLAMEDLPTIIAEGELHDRMTQSVVFDKPAIAHLFDVSKPKEFTLIPFHETGQDALRFANQNFNLGLNDQELAYLSKLYHELERDPTDVELMMFAQANSEHCRHKIFNAQFFFAGELQSESLFQKIRYTYQCHAQDILSAYSDNAAVIKGHVTHFWSRNDQHHYRFNLEPVHLLMKVETHNHPTAIAPFPGAATGAGGELRDEGATGRGGRPKAGMTGFCVSDLLIPNLSRPWECHIGKPAHMADALQIMLQAPIGSASYNNEFGRPNLAGFFRSYCQRLGDGYRGYHKPIMIAGGYGNIRDMHVKKVDSLVDAQLIVLGGPAMEIGLGGGAASSNRLQELNATSDYAAVQRANPEMQRRCQEVIDHCIALGNENPILSIHDVGAGGLSNAIPELIYDVNCGGVIELRRIPSADSGMSPLAIWCNEAQERYVLAIDMSQETLFSQIAIRERCPFVIVGKATAEQTLQVVDTQFNNQPVNLPLPKLLGSLPPLQCSANHFKSLGGSIQWQQLELLEAIKRVLQLPSVASKQFLITIGDRSVGGYVTRDQMIGPWQVPVSDVAVTASSYIQFCGEAMAIGERPPLALLNPAASARIAVGEMLTNMIAADIEKLADIKLSANWMAACGEAEENGALFVAVDAIAKHFCPALGLTIPVGKDSLSMQTDWLQEDQPICVKAPLSVIITGFAPVRDVRKTLVPAFQQANSSLYFIDLAAGKQRLGGSALLQTYQQLGDEAPDVEDTNLLRRFMAAMIQLKTEGLVLAYHDRSDGGLLTTLAEMTFASHIGWQIDVTSLGVNIFAILFNEELGAILEVNPANQEKFHELISQHELNDVCHCLGKTVAAETMEIYYQAQSIIRANRVTWQEWWSEVSYAMQALRDNPECAQQEYHAIQAVAPTLFSHFTFALDQPLTLPFSQRPKVAILREQGVNGHMEMAAAFYLAGFDAIDVHMSDILSGQEDLSQMIGLVVGGGFSYGDVLGAGRGWANTILHHSLAKQVFKIFFERRETFTLGVCNGCQMLSYLKSFIPGADHFPTFVKNQSRQFEARLSMVEITSSPSIFFQGMVGSQLPIVVAHGEGQVNYTSNQQPAYVAMRYIDAAGIATENYPANPNGSLGGITAVTSTDGRVTIMMPHPERIFRTVQASWYPTSWDEEMSPWFTMFCNAYRWVRVQ